MPDDATWLKDTLKHEKGKRRWTPYRGSPERQCTATSKQSGKRCKANRLKRPDGSLAPTCKMHGGELGSLESQERNLKALERYLTLRLNGVQSKLAAVQDAIARAHVMNNSTCNQLVTHSPAVYSGEIVDSQSNQVVSGEQPDSSQASPLEPPAGDVGDVGPTDRSTDTPLPPMSDPAKTLTPPSRIPE